MLRSVPGVSLMTRENMLVLLQSSGKKLEDCEGECEVETGRRLEWSRNSTRTWSLPVARLCVSIR